MNFSISPSFALSEVFVFWTLSNVARVSSSEDLAIAERSVSGMASILSRIAFFAEVISCGVAKPSAVAHFWMSSSFTEFKLAEVANPVNFATSVRVASLARVESSEDFATAERSTSGMFSIPARISFFAEFTLSRVASPSNCEDFARVSSSEDFATSERSVSGMLSMLS